jgi:hypothetical protein
MYTCDFSASLFFFSSGSCGCVQDNTGSVRVSGCAHTLSVCTVSSAVAVAAAVAAATAVRCSSSSGASHCSVFSAAVRAPQAGTALHCTLLQFCSCAGSSVVIQAYYQAGVL